MLELELYYQLLQSIILVVVRSTGLPGTPVLEQAYCTEAMSKVEMSSAKNIACIRYAACTVSAYNSYSECVIHIQYNVRLYCTIVLRSSQQQHLPLACCKQRACVLVLHMVQYCMHQPTHLLLSPSYKYHQPVLRGSTVIVARVLSVCTWYLYTCMLVRLLLSPILVSGTHNSTTYTGICTWYSHCYCTSTAPMAKLNKQYQYLVQVHRVLRVHTRLYFSTPSMNYISLTI